MTTLVISEPWEYLTLTDPKPLSTIPTTARIRRHAASNLTTSGHPPRAVEGFQDASFPQHALHRNNGALTIAVIFNVR